MTRVQDAASSHTGAHMPGAHMPARAELARDFLVAPLASDTDVSGSHTTVIRVGDDASPATPVPCVVAIGAFDGVHRGHLGLLSRARRDAAERGVAAIAVTFDPDPDEVVGKRPALKLLSIADRIKTLRASGTGVVVVPFTRELAALDHVAFFEQVLAPYVDIRAIHVGVDFRLGARGASTVDVIRAWGANRGVEVTGHELLIDGDAPITATRIRRLIAAGDVVAAAGELGRRFYVHGVVAPGRGEGAGMGFPTANIEVQADIQMPADGVYAGFARVGGEVWPAAINAGVPPMFADSAASARLEANLIGYHGDLYGREVSIAFDRMVRPSHSFESIDALIRAVEGDIAQIAADYGTTPVRIA